MNKRLMLAVALATALVGCTRAPEKSPGQACLDSFRMKLKDPESGRVISFENGKLVYTATNSFGARVQSTALCTDRLGKWERDDRSEIMAVVDYQRRLFKAAEECRAAGHKQCDPGPAADDMDLARKKLGFD